MAQGKKSFIAYADWKAIFDELPNEDAGALIKHIFAYVNDENPTSDSVLIRAVFANIKATLKRDLEKWDSQLQQRSDAGRRSAEKRSATKFNDRSTTVNETVRNSTDSVSVNVSVSDNVNEKKVVKVKFSDFVSMFPEEHQKLLDEFGEIDTLEIISILNNYKGAKGKKYKSDYLAIRNWVVDRMNENKLKSNNAKTINNTSIRNDNQSIAAGVKVFQA